MISSSLGFLNEKDINENIIEKTKDEAKNEKKRVNFG